MCCYSDFVKSTLHHHHGQAPKRSLIVQAFTAACLLRDRAYGIDTITKASIACGASPSYIAAATILLQTRDAVLINAVLEGREPLLRAAGNARNCAKLVTASCHKPIKADSPDLRNVQVSNLGVPEPAVAHAKCEDREKRSFDRFIKAQNKRSFEQFAGPKAGANHDQRSTTRHPLHPGYRGRA